MDGEPVYKFLHLRVGIDPYGIFVIVLVIGFFGTDTYGLEC